MKPGEHLIVIGTELDALEARASGLHLRDSLLILLPGPRTLTAYLFRAPIEGTVAANVLAHGTGALHIDACRIFTDWNEADRPESWKRSGNTAKPDAAKIAAPPGTGITCHPGGRWPTNLVLVHGPGCKRVGEKRVPGSKTGSTVQRNTSWSSTAYAQDAWTKTKMHRSVVDHTDADGTETVAAWDCQPDCPVRLLEEQSGYLHGSGNQCATRTSPFAQLGGAGYKPQDINPNYHVNEGGGVSRFYPQFAGLPAALDWLARLIGA